MWKMKSVQGEDAICANNNSRYIQIQNICSWIFFQRCKRGQSSSVQVKPRATLTNPVNIENLEEDEGVERRSVEAQVAHKV